ncbi:Heparinase II/III-like protein [Candidatus Methanophagaceae archaeon]|nr:Heparinase II/III-like protein [Methanophagales archaeon]
MSVGHKHNSRLSFALFAGDKSFSIDPRAYVYTADKEMRNMFRSTKYHNTVVVDGEEQNRFEEDELFAMNLDAAVKVNG